MDIFKQIQEQLREKIMKERDWSNPYWLGEVKEENPDISEEDLDNFYCSEIQAKIESMSKEELWSLCKEQINLTSANQNYFRGCPR